MVFDGPAFLRHIAERLIHEFSFASGAGTPGLIGAAKEHPARIQLEKLMPANVRVGSGIVMDSYGGMSRQQDIVIFETLCPVFTHNDAPEATFYPVEGVVAVGEVKSGLGKNEMIDAVEKSASVKSLRRRAIATDDGLGMRAVSFRNYGTATSFSGTIEEEFSQDRKSLDQVCTFILCERFSSSYQTTLSNFARECARVGSSLMPNVVTSLENGCIFPHKSASGSIMRALMDGDGAIFSPNAIIGFAQLVKMLRLYAVSGRTVERKHFEIYFDPPGGEPASFEVKARVSI